MTKVTITASDGSEFNAYMARPERTPAPAIIVIQEIFGVNAKIRAICDDFARQGYIALAPDLFWRQEPGVELNDASQEDFGKAMAYMSGFDFMLGIDDLKAALLQARRLEGASGKVGVVGYCLGGSLAYMMACFSDADASVGYYPVQIDPHLGHAEHIAKPLMLHIGEQDALCPPESQDAIWAGLSPNPLVSLHSYAGADHAFARVGGENYDSSAAQLANGRTAELFARVLR